MYWISTLILREILAAPGDEIQTCRCVDGNEPRPLPGGPGPAQATPQRCLRVPVRGDDGEPQQPPQGFGGDP